MLGGEGGICGAARTGVAKVRGYIRLRRFTCSFRGLRRRRGSRSPCGRVRSFSRGRRRSFSRRRRSFGRGRCSRSLSGRSRSFSRRYRSLSRGRRRSFGGSGSVGLFQTLHYQPRRLTCLHVVQTPPQSKVTDNTRNVRWPHVSGPGKPESCELLRSYRLILN